MAIFDNILSVRGCSAGVNRCEFLHEPAVSGCEVDCLVHLWSLATWEGGSSPALANNHPDFHKPEL